MSRPLTHRPFAGLEPPKPEVMVVKRRTTDPETGLSLVRQIRSVPLPTDPPPTARLTPDPSEPAETMAPKKKSKGNKPPWTPERRAKFMATIAKQGKQIRSKKKKRKKARSIEASATRTPIAQRKNTPRNYGVKSIGSLLDEVVGCLEEIRRRLAALSL